MNFTRRTTLKLGLLAPVWPGLMGCGDGGGEGTSGDIAPLPMKVEKNVQIPLRDGGFVVADVFRPDVAGRFPVLMSMGPYPKDIAFKDWSPTDFERQEMKGEHMHWETPLPDYWVPRGYVQIRCDQRGSGASPGRLDILGPQVQQDFYDAIEWAGRSAWSNGNVGTVGDSYFGAVQWLVAQLNPPHLKAMLVAQGFSDIYRDAIRHGGILNARFLDFWYQGRIRNFQYGAARNPVSPKLTAAELDANTVFAKDFRLLLRDDAPATDPLWTQRTPQLANIRAAVFAYTNNGGLGLHLNGTINGFNGCTNAVHRQLYTGVGQDPDFMYRVADVERQMRFFDRFLKGRLDVPADPAVEVTVRSAGGNLKRTGNSYPLPSTVLQTLHLDATGLRLDATAAATLATTTYQADYAAKSAPAMFQTAALGSDLEIVGPARLRLWVSASVADADLFVSLHEIRADGSEVTVQGAQDPQLPITMGWLRVSRRHIDAARSGPLQAWHTHTRQEPMTPGEIYAVDVNLWPIAWRLGAGSRLALRIGGSEQPGMVTFTHPPAGPFAPGAPGGAPLSNGAAPAGQVTIHCGPGFDSALTLPVHPV